MRKRITLLVTALVMALMMALGGMAFAVNSSSCTFEKGTTTCTTIHGSHGSTDTHNGQVGSNGKDTGGSTGKVTGSDHTIQ
jgi:hypothetical protein